MGFSKSIQCLVARFSSRVEWIFCFFGNILPKRYKEVAICGRMCEVSIRAFANFRRIFISRKYRSYICDRNRLLNTGLLLNIVAFFVTVRIAY